MATNIVSVVLRAKNEIGKTLGQVRQGVVKLRKELEALQQDVVASGGGVKAQEAFQKMDQNVEAVAATAILASKNVEELADSIKGASKEGDNFDESAKRARGGAQGLGSGFASVAALAGAAGSSLKGFADNNREATNSITPLINGVKLLASGFLAFQAVRAAKGFADTAARTQVLGTVLGVVAKNAGFFSDEINTLDSQIQKLGITASSSRGAIQKLIQSNLIVPGESEKALKLARSAQDLAVVTGENSSQTLERLIVNIQQLDTLGARFQGLIIDREAADAKFAKSIGKTAAALTRAEQQQSFLNAALEEANKLAGAYVAALGDVGKQLSSLDRVQEEASVSIGEKLLPAYGEIVLEFTDFLKKSTEVIKGFDKNGEAALRFAKALRIVLVALKETALFILENIGTFALVAGILFGPKLVGLAVSLALKIGAVTKGLLGLAAAYKSVGAAGTFFFKELGNAANTLKPVNTATKFFSDVIAPGVKLGLSNALRSVLTALTSPARLLKLATGLAVGLAFAIGTAIGTALSSVSSINLGAQAIIGWLENSYLRAKKGLLEFFGQETAEVVKQLEINRAVRDSIADAGKKSFFQQAQEATLEFDNLAVKIRNYTEALTELEKKEGKTAIDLVQIDDLKKQLDEAKEQQKQYLSIVKKTTRELTADQKKQIQQQSNDRKAAAAAEVTAFSKQKDEFNAALKQLGQAETQEFGITAEFTKSLAAAELLLKTLEQPVESPEGSGLEDLGVTLDELTLRFQKLATAAKSPQEIQRFLVLLSKLDRSAKFSSASLNALQAAAQIDFKEAVVSEYDKKLSGLIRTAEGLKQNFDLVKETNEAVTSSTEKVTEQLAKFGVTSIEAIGGVTALGSSLLNVADASKRIGEVSLTRLQRQAVALRVSYEQELKTLQAFLFEKKQLVQEEFSDQTDATKRIANATQALEEDSNRKRLQVQKKFLDDLLRLRDQSVSQFARSLDKIRAAEERIRGIREDSSEEERDRLREKLGPVRAYYDRLKELKELDLAQTRAFLAKDIAEQERINEKRIRLAKELEGAEGIDPRKSQKRSQKELNKARQDAIAIQERVIRQEKELAKTAGDQIQSITATINTIRSEISTLAGEQVASLSVVLNQEIYDQTKRDLDLLADPKELELTVTPILNNDALEAVFQSIKAKFKIDNLTSPLRRATGGFVSGPGTSTSDSIPALLSDGEYVVKAAAVKRYGLGFLERLNQMSLRGLSLGGTVGVPTTPYGMVPAFANGGAVSGAAGNRDVVDINFNVGSQRVSLMAERDQARSFVDLLNSIEGIR